MGISANKSVRITTTIPDNIPDTLYKVFEPIIECDKSGLSLYIHGSWADNTNIFFSDIDDFVIIDESDENLDSNIKLLERTEMNLAKYDPLQHHGHWKIKKQQLKHYDDAFLPHYIFKDSLCLKGNELIDFELCNKGLENKMIHYLLYTFHNICTKNRQIRKGKLNLFQLKALASSYALIPPLLYQILGEEFNKREAIKIFIKNYSNDRNIEAFLWASEVRLNFGIIKNFYRYKIFSTFPYFFKTFKKWYNFAIKYAPSYHIDQFTDKRFYSQNQYSSFCYLCHNIIRPKIIRKFSMADYEKVLLKFVTTVDSSSYISIYQFGEIKDPGISDIDILLICDNGHLKTSYDTVRKIIDLDEKLNYLFIHDPIIIERRDIEKFSKIHSLNNLKLLYGKDLISEIKNNGGPDDNQIYENWQLFLLQYVHEVLNNPESHNERVIHHLLKNIAVSIYKLHGNYNYIEEVKELRALCLSGKFLKKESDDKLKCYYDSLCKLISGRTYKPTKSLKNKFIVGRNSIFVKGKQVNIYKLKNKTIYEFPEPLYHHSYDIIINYKKRNEIKTIWMELFLKYRSLDVPLMTVFPFPYQWLRTKPNNIRLSLKYWIYDTVSYFPLSIITKLI